jgi:outer membrane translocation and assembly module TamA
VHVRTRPSVVESVLLFDVGERFQGRLLEESARALRARGFLAEATLEARNYDPVTNTVEVDVRVRDSWTLAPDVKLSRSGGENEWGVGMSDGNLFGTGKSLTVSYASDVDRDETFLGYADGNVMSSRVVLNTVFANASDGHRRELAAERPFYSLDTRWALGGAVRDSIRVDTMYDLGEEIDEFEHENRSLTLQGGLSRGLIGTRTQRWLFGVTSAEDAFRPTVETPTPLLLPGDRKLVYPWVGWQLVEDSYREVSELNDMGRTEDISLGLNILASIGFARASYGSDRDATLLEIAAQKGWEPGGPGRLLLLEAGGATRDEDTGLRNSQVRFGARYYRRNLEKHLFSVTLNALTTNKLDPENQVLLGGDNGLRGYPLRYQAGKQLAIVNVEQRFYTDLYPWRLFRVGYAVFADAGRVSGRDPRAAPSLGTLYDVGVGLRLSSPRSSGRSVVHIDLAFPLNGDPTIDKAQLVVETKGSF